jgi:UDP-glucose 4-epimerase
MADVGRTWLVTGGAGFIGSHLVEALLARGERALVLDDLSTGRRANLDRAFASPAGAERLELHVGTVVDRPLVASLVARSDRVVHLAAAVGVRLILDEPVRTLETNIHGTEVVVAECGRRSTPLFVASSSEVYGKGTRCPFREDDDVVLGPTTKSRWSYAASKMVDEFLALSWHRERGLPVRVGRFFNTVGPRQVGQYGMVLPRFVTQALSGGPLTVYGDGRQSRAFAHVLDVVECVVRLMDTPATAGQVFNVGGREEVTVRALAERVRDLVDPGVQIVTVPYEEAYAAGFEDLGRRVPDVSRLAAAVGFVPARSLDEILADTVAHLSAERSPGAS